MWSESTPIALGAEQVVKNIHNNLCSSTALCNERRKNKVCACVCNVCMNCAFKPLMKCDISKSDTAEQADVSTMTNRQWLTVRKYEARQPVWLCCVKKRSCTEEVFCHRNEAATCQTLHVVRIRKHRFFFPQQLAQFLAVRAALNRLHGKSFVCCCFG